MEPGTRERAEIGGDIEIVVVHAGQDGVKLGVRAPRDVAVYRGELYEQIASENRAAVAAAPPREDVLAALRRDQEARKSVGKDPGEDGDR